MARNMQEYNTLLNLRKAIKAKAAATAKMQQLKLDYDRASCNLLPPGKANTTVTTCQDSLKQALYNAVESKLIAKASKKADNVDTIKKLGLFFLLSAILGVGGYFTFLLAQKSWNDSIVAMENSNFGLADSMVSYNCAVGVHLMAFSVMLFVFSIAIGLIIIATKHDSAGTIVMTTGIIASIVFCIMSFSYYYRECEGFWEVMGYFFNSFALIGLFFDSITRIVIFLLALSTTVLLSVLVFLMLIQPVSDTVSIVPPTIDYSELYATPEYKEAVRLDAEASKKSKENYDAYYQEEKRLSAKKQSIISGQMEVCSKILTQCNQTIQEASKILHPSYHNLDSLDMIISYIEFNRADTIKEAINEYIRDSQYMKIMGKLDEIQQAHVREIQRQTGIITKKLDQVSNDMIHSVNQINQTINAQTASINAALDDVRRDNNNNARRIENSIYDSSQRLSDRLSQKMDSMASDITYHIRTYSS